MGIDKLILDELDGQVHDHADDRLTGRSEQGEERADGARREGAHIRHEGEDRGEEADEPGIRQAEEGERDEDKRAQDARLQALPREYLKCNLYNV